MPTDLLYRAAAGLHSDPDGRTVHGLAVPYARAAEVDDGFGPYREMFAPGAFSRSIRERAHKVKLYAEHVTRNLPIGRAVELREDDDGLHAAFAVARTRAGDEALELVRSMTVDGFSVGFRGIRHERDHDGTIIRTEAALHEVSLTGAPAYADAAIAGVRSSVPRLSADTARRRLDLFLETW